MIPFSSQSLLQFTSQDAIGNLLSRTPSPSLINSLAERLIKKLEGQSGFGWKEQAQRIIDIYLSQLNEVSQTTQMRLHQLQDEFAYQSLDEMRSKYEVLLSQNRIDETDPLFLKILLSLFKVQGEKTDWEKQFQWVPVYRDEMLRLIIQHKKEKALLKGADFNCYVLEYRDLPAMVEMYEKQQQGWFQLLVRNEVHYTAMDCHIEKERKICTLLDASQDPKHLLLKQMMEQMGFEVITPGLSEEDKIQWDNRSCSIFALSQASQCTRDPHFYEKLKNHPQFNQQIKRIPWSALPPDFVKDCQKEEFFYSYPQLMQEPYKNQPNFCHFLLSQYDKNRFIETEQNRGIEQKLSKYQQIVIKMLNTRSEEELNAIARTHPFKTVSCTIHHKFH